jgi:hypothetical protein
MAKRVIIIVLGSILLLGGAAVAVGGAALMIVFGSDSKAASGQHRVTTQRVALVASINDIKDTDGYASTVGRATLRLTATSTNRKVFIGVGPAAAVERYLAGAPIDRVTDLEVDPFRLTTRARPGSTIPAAPAGQPFWTTSDSGTSASISWKISDGSYRLVVMNADATPRVAADAQAALSIPHLFAIGLAILIGGAVVAIAGIILIVLGARMRDTRRPATAE